MIDVRERITDHGLRRRAARQAKRSARPLIIVLTTLAIGAVCAIYLVLHIDKTALVGSNTYSFQVADANGVMPSVDEVRFKGIPAGEITSVALHGTQPVITVALESSFGQIYRNATAQLRPNTPLQDMFLNITSRGTPSAGLASTADPVSSDQTDTSVNISDVLNVFAGNERARLAQLLAALGNGLADRGLALRTAFEELVPFVAQAGRITQQLSIHSGLTKQLIHNAGVLTTALGQRAAQIRTLVADGSQVADTLGASSPALQQTLSELPPTISTADGALSALSGVLPSVNGAVTSLDPVADTLPRALAEIRTLTRVAQPAVDALQTPVARLVPFATTLRPVASNLSASVHTLLPQIPVVIRTVSDVGNCLPALYGFFAWDASMAKFGDARGAAPRGNAVAGAQTLGIKNGFEFAPQACTPGTAIGGRLPQPGDYH